MIHDIKRRDTRRRHAQDFAPHPPRYWPGSRVQYHLVRIRHGLPPARIGRWPRAPALISYAPLSERARLTGIIRLLPIFDMLATPLVIGLATMLAFALRRGRPQQTPDAGTRRLNIIYCLRRRATAGYKLSACIGAVICDAVDSPPFWGWRSGTLASHMDMRRRDIALILHHNTTCGRFHAGR